LQAQEVAPSVRIVNRIDEHSLVTLKGNTHPAAKAKNDRGRVSTDLPMTDLILVLSRSPQQQAAFEKFVASEYDSSSPNFHQWLTPEEIGQKYGPSETDIATVSQWLGGRGFTVDEVPNDRMTIRFSGTAAMVESAFHTEIHNLDVKGAAHIANMSDPQIPVALTPVVVGVKALHNFFPHPLHKLGSQVKRDAATGRWKRVASEAARPATARTQFGTIDSSGDLLEEVGPYDFATIYNVLPLWNASTPVTGAGQTIAIVGTSDINPADVTSFRATFGLPAYTTNAPIQQVVHGPDPGNCPGAASAYSTCAGDLIENTLDVEWSGSIAPAAQIFLAVSGSNSASDDTVWDSSSYVINNQATVNSSILNVSYGECELFEGVAGNLSYYNLWQTAYASGIAVFVASGDSGSATCDQGGDQEYGVPYAAEYGLSVSGLASTPYNTAVGGTDLMWCPVTTMATLGCMAPAAQYWNRTNSTTTNSSALGTSRKFPGTTPARALKELLISPGFWDIRIMAPSQMPNPPATSCSNTHRKFTSITALTSPAL
jgi:subtilase family serine protease